MRGAGADFHVERLQQRTALLVPIVLQTQDDLLKGDHESDLKENFPGGLVAEICREPRILTGLRAPTDSEAPIVASGRMIFAPAPFADDGCGQQQCAGKQDGAIAPAGIRCIAAHALNVQVK